MNKFFEILNSFYSLSIITNTFPPPVYLSYGFFIAAYLVFFATYDRINST